MDQLHENKTLLFYRKNKNVKTREYISKLKQPRNFEIKYRKRTLWNSIVALSFKLSEIKSFKARLIIGCVPIPIVFDS